MKKRVCWALALGMLVSSINTNVVFASTKNAGKEAFLSSANKIEEKAKEQIEEEDVKIEEHQKVLEIMGLNDETCDTDDLKDNYAGSYLDNEGNMVVVLDKDESGNKKLESKIEKIDSEIEVKKAEYNCKELEAAKEQYDIKMDKLLAKSELTEDEKNICENIVGCGISLENNRVTVYMKNTDKNNITLFKKYVMNNDIIEFVQNVDENEDSATKLKLGRAIYKYEYTSGNTVYSTRCSIGLKAYTIDSNGKKRYGFVTCGHGLAKGDTIYIDGLCKTKIGKVIKRKYSGKVDASFVEVTNSNYTPSRVVYYSNSSGSTSDGKTISTNYLYVWYTGFTVYKAGSTTYLTSGTLTSYNYSTTIGNVAFKDMYEAKIKVKGGDSGGIMYTKNDGEYCALGITKCSNGTYSGFIKWNNIDDSFEIYFY